MRFEDMTKRGLLLIHPQAPNMVYWWCQGCETYHALNIVAGSRPCWGFDGNYDAPTFSPSVLVRYDRFNTVCHTFVRAGQVEYLSDCTHALAGKTVPLTVAPDPLPEKAYGG